MEWELVSSEFEGSHTISASRIRTARIAVPGGWLYRVVMEGPNTQAVSTTFVPVSQSLVNERSKTLDSINRTDEARP
jgi:hypothetical protein